MTDAADTVESLRNEYLALAHAMQSAVAYGVEMDKLVGEGKVLDAKHLSPTHLRVGVNSAMVDHGALVGLLLEKGVITELEYYRALRDGMAREVESYRSYFVAAGYVNVSFG